ncbi:MAG: response regulator, partial [Candidatus Omnitrophica bacterium]|nr:response regulator [Candidatus Omnitrophota bacterium]
MPENKRIFICDDDEEVLTSLRKLLELSGFEVK